MNGQSEIVDYQMEQLLSATKMQNYYRFQPQYSETNNSHNHSIDTDDLIYVNDQMDDVSVENISNLQKAANRFIDFERDNLRRLIEQLLTKV